MICTGAGTVSCCLCLFIQMKSVEMWLHWQSNIPLNFISPLSLKDWRDLFYFALKANIMQLTSLDKNLKAKNNSGIKIIASKCSLFER